MKVFNRNAWSIFLILFFGFACMDVWAQTDNDTLAQQMPVDSARINAIKERFKQEFKDSLSYESDTIVAVLVKKIEEVTELVNKANRISEEVSDTLDISKNLPVTEHLLRIVESNFITKSSYQNLRALKSARGLLIQSETQLESWQNILFDHADKLADIKVRLSEVRKDAVFRKLPNDSLLRDMYFGQIANLSLRWKMTDSVININMLHIGLLQNRVATDFLRAKDFLGKTNDKLKKYIQELWLPEEPSLLKATNSDYDVSLGQAYTSSAVTIANIIVYYFEINTSLWVTSLILILTIYAWFLRTVFKLKKQELFSAGLRASSKLVTKAPLLSAAGLVLTLISIFFFNLPPTWNSLIWTLLAIFYFMLSRFSKKNSKIFRPEFLLIFLIFNSLNVLLKNSFEERWIQLALGLVNIGYGVFMLRQLLKNGSSYPAYAKLVFYIFIIFSAGAVITNSYGSFMLAKVLNNGAVYAVVTANVLYITAEMIIQVIHLQQEAFKGTRLFSYFDLYNLRLTLGKLLRMAAFLAWLMIMAQQLNFFDYAYEWIYSFLNSERKLGSSSFTFGNILVFVIVIWFSSFLSKIIMAFFGQGQGSSNTKKSRWSSMLILIRLGVLSAGILFAFAASGIPMDKLTIIIGALGVGIGFGLQNIVNNLVSGVILAFEKPVQIGDSIEVGNRFGVVQEIGIRSSKILTVEGSEVIVPNGDMLSQHIVNWTLSSHFRRVELVVSVAYSTDLRLAENILQNIIAEQKDIEKSLESMVVAHQFAESSITFRLLFWCHIDTWINVKSEVLMKVHQAFNEKGIEIPFPQRDINIKDIDKLMKTGTTDEKKEN